MYQLSVLLRSTIQINPKTTVWVALKIPLEMAKSIEMLKFGTLVPTRFTEI